MIEESKNKNSVLKVLLFLFIIFFIIYISSEKGYFEYQTYSKNRLTEESIKLFEKDVNEGKNVLLKDYIVEEKKDYRNFLNKTGSKIGSIIETIMNDGIKKTLKVLNSLFYEES